jgi:hypothetical protein
MAHVCICVHIRQGQGRACLRLPPLRHGLQGGAAKRRRGVYPRRKPQGGGKPPGPGTSCCACRPCGPGGGRGRPSERTWRGWCRTCRARACASPSHRRSPRRRDALGLRTRSSRRSDQGASVSSSVPDERCGTLGADEVASGGEDWARGSTGAHARALWLSGNLWVPTPPPLRLTPAACLPWGDGSEEAA